MSPKIFCLLRRFLFLVTAFGFATTVHADGPRLGLSLQFGASQPSQIGFTAGFQPEPGEADAVLPVINLVSAHHVQGGQGWSVQALGMNLTGPGLAMAEDSQGMSTSTKWLIGLGLAAVSIYALNDAIGDGVDRAANRAARDGAEGALNPGDDEPEDEEGGGAVACTPVACL